jgi:molybdate transport system substrate-binding protein
MLAARRSAAPTLSRLGRGRNVLA